MWAVVAAGMWLPWKNFLPCLPSFLFSGGKAAHEEEDTDGVAYSDVPKIKHTEVERYVCPAATTRVDSGPIETLIIDHTTAKLVKDHWTKLHSRSAEAKAARAKEREEAKLNLHV
mmetsp:Transcript_76287/g.228919  ORF Transcript_76287/g.228919 Transcript_76287/m.228919 type:complete len:115 (+) Transcript_76287:3-347(+)